MCIAGHASQARKYRTCQGFFFPFPHGMGTRQSQLECDINICHVVMLENTRGESLHKMPQG